MNSLLLLLSPHLVLQIGYKSAFSFWSFSHASEVPCFFSDVFLMPSLMLPDYRCGQNILQDTQLTSN